VLIKDITELPQWAPVIKTSEGHLDPTIARRAVATNSGPYAWSNGNPPPKRGDEVVVKMNRLGVGHVDSYFVEHGYLGVKVALKEPPDWLLKQSGDRFAMVFGAEITY
jgi:hypothetical protein